MKFYGTRGLRSWRSKCKGASLRLKLQYLYNELSYAWERAWYGYSSYDIWEFFSSMSCQMADMLRTFKEDSPFILIDADTNEELSKEEAEKIYSRIIKCLEYGSNEDLCYEELYGRNILDEDIWDYNFEKYAATSDLMDKYKREAFELLEKYWHQLWW